MRKDIMTKSSENQNWLIFICEVRNLKTTSKRTEELKIRISLENKERIKFKMDDAGILNMNAYVRKMALDSIYVRLFLAVCASLPSCSGDTPIIWTSTQSERTKPGASMWQILMICRTRFGIVQTVPCKPCRYSVGGKGTAPPTVFLFWQVCVHRFSGPPMGARSVFPLAIGITAFVSRTRSQPRQQGLFKGFGTLSQQSETAVSGNAENRSFESLWEQRHCLPDSETVNAWPSPVMIYSCLLHRTPHCHLISLWNVPLHSGF